MEKSKTLVHGGDWAGFEKTYGYRPLDFSANISPLGMPEKVQRAIVESLADADRYPDPLCRELTGELAAFEAVAREHILCGNGAADLLFRLALSLRPEKALVPAPSFLEYEAALDTVRCGVRRYLLAEESGFKLDDGFVEAITEETDVVFLCQPNNPTGVTDGRALLEKVLVRCRQKGAILVIDECFNDFLDQPKAHTMKGFLCENPHLVILKSFTKLYAMAGVRLGYCLCSDEGLLEKMRRAGQPWGVSDMAQKAGVAALQEREYVQSVRALVRRERRWLMKRLVGLGFSVLPGEANYLLFRSFLALECAMREKGILIRNCANYHGLGEGWYRVAVRTHAENLRLAGTLEAVLEAFSEEAHEKAAHEANGKFPHSGHGWF